MLYNPERGPDEPDPEELFECRLCWGEWPECDMANPSLCRECFSGFEECRDDAFSAVCRDFLPVGRSK